MPKEIEEAFQKTTEVLLGRPLTNLERYEKWLMRHLVGPVKVKSKLSGKPVYVVQTTYYKHIGDNLATYDESVALGNEKKLGEKEAEGLTLANSVKTLAKISMTTPEIRMRENINAIECACYGPTQHCFRSYMCWFSKYAGYCYWIREGDHTFGGGNFITGVFCINVYNSTRLTRCFEVSESNDCADCYYCHYCENLNECMFCFNVKGLRYAIGNVEVGPVMYAKFKKMLQERIVRELEATGDLKLDIFEIARKNGKSNGAKNAKQGKIGMVKKNGKAV